MPSLEAYQGESVDVEQPEGAPQIDPAPEVGAPAWRSYNQDILDAILND